MNSIHYSFFTILLAISSSILWLSCNESEVKTPKSIITWDTDPAFFTDSMIETPCEFLPATFNPEPPHENINYPAYVLMNGQYHGDEVTKEMQNANWYSLYKEQQTFTLAKLTVQFKQVHDGIVDDDTTIKTGVEVSGGHEVEVLIGKVAGLKIGQLDAVSLDTNIILPGKSYYFDYGNAHYRLYATAYRYKEQNEGQYSIRNYKLYLEKQENGQPTKQLIVARPYVDDTYYLAKIFFAGDIDADGKPDIIMNVSMYNGNNTILYLSGKAEPGQLLKAMAIHTSVGC